MIAIFTGAFTAATLARNDQPSTDTSFGSSDAAAVMLGLGVATMVPAHGYVLSSRGQVATPSPIGSWFRSFLASCAWAFMIAAGSLVYNHFVKKWQTHGLPMLPVAAMTQGANQGAPQYMGQQPSPGFSSTPAAPAGGLNPGPQFQRAQAPGRPSYMEEYAG